jgi:hypothetical protein
MGTTYVGIVARAITDADVRQATNQQNVPQTYRDGRPKFIMVVPMLVQGSAEFPEGLAGWWVKGQARDELVRAMAEAGAPAGPPEAGALIQCTLVGQRPIPGMNPAYQYRIVYTRPTGAPPAVAAMAQPTIVAAPAPMGYMTPDGPVTYDPRQYAAPPAQPVYAAPAPQYAPQVPPAPVQPVYAAQAARSRTTRVPAPVQPVYAAPAPQYAPQVPPAPVQPVYAAPAPQYAPQVPPAPVQPVYAAQAAPPAVTQGVPAPGLTAEQQALMARLTGASA